MVWTCSSCVTAKKKPLFGEFQTKDDWVRHLSSRVHQFNANWKYGRLITKVFPDEGSQIVITRIPSCPTRDWIMQFAFWIFNFGNLANLIHIRKYGFMIATVKAGDDEGASARLEDVVNQVDFLGHPIKIYRKEELGKEQWNEIYRYQPELANVQDDFEARRAVLPQPDIAKNQEGKTLHVQPAIVDVVNEAVGFVVVEPFMADETPKDLGVVEKQDNMDGMNGEKLPGMVKVGRLCLPTVFVEKARNYISSLREELNLRKREETDGEGNHTVIPMERSEGRSKDTNGISEGRQRGSSNSSGEVNLVNAPDMAQGPNQITVESLRNGSEDNYRDSEGIAVAQNLDSGINNSNEDWPDHMNFSLHWFHFASVSADMLELN